MHSRLELMFLFLVVACTPEVEDTAEPDTSVQDTAPAERIGLEARTGQAQVSLANPASYSGQETWTFTADSGAGEEVCRIQYALHSTGARLDCDLCDWAFDVSLLEAEFVSEADPGCEAVFGIGSGNVGDLNGVWAGYGYSAEYFGHAAVFFLEVEGEWVALGNAEFDEATGAYSYERLDGYVAY
jgi:hypothetical protein